MIKKQRCSVSECSDDAGYEVIFYDFYLMQGKPFYEQHIWCPFICAAHLNANP